MSLQNEICLLRDNAKYSANIRQPMIQSKLTQFITFWFT